MALRHGLDIGSDTLKAVLIDDKNAITKFPLLKIQGQPLRRVQETLAQVNREIEHPKLKNLEKVQSMQVENAQTQN